ncbi:hypothetical protein K1719_005607 [Acacia pycnantha]|nr:hypothetical protein K1719_005607 [Acacia pycnantha]
MIQNYQDAMAICAWAGYPNIFLTFTCNPMWPEITRHCEKDGLKPCDKPEILSRVFHMKLDKLMRILKDEKILGSIKADVYTVKFQKRGLPHAHIILYDPELYELVGSYMVHGPCGRSSRNAPCMKDGECSKLLKLFCGHLSIEKTNQSHAIKYLFKYISKGNGRVIAGIYNNNDSLGSQQSFDEVSHYLNCRSLNDYPSLPTPVTDNIFDISNQLIFQELNYNKIKEREESERLQQLMTAEQKQVFDEIMGVASSKKGGFFFLHGFGRTGKTFIWNALTASVRSNGGIILNVASSEIAATLLPSKYLNAIKCSGFPHHKLVLKIGVPVMLIRNIDQAAGLCNGTRLQITQLGKTVVKAKALNGTRAGEEILMHRMDMNPSETTLPFKMTRRQFPIIISFAMTINKSQDQSLSNAGLYLPSSIFSHGQLYVAMSRVKNFSGLKIHILNEFGKCSNTTINVVYREVFQNLLFH